MRTSIKIATFLLFVCISLQAQRGRVQIQNGTVVTDSGTLLRGALDRNYFVDFDWEDHKQDIRTIKEYGLNCIHMYMEGPSEEIAESNLPYYDSLVSWTREDSLYLLMTPGWWGDNVRDIEFIRKFWAKIALRYAEETHLIFEIVNEPQPGSAPYDSLTLEMHRSVYDTIRKYAPETHIMFMSYADNINANSAVLDIQSLGSGIDWGNASISAHGYVYSAETTREFIHTVQDSGYAVTITECPSVGDGWEVRYINMAFMRIFEEEFISSLHHIELKNAIENPEVFKKKIESSEIRWSPDFGTWPESVINIDYKSPYQNILAGFNDAGYNIHRSTDSSFMYGIVNNAYIGYYNLNFQEGAGAISLDYSPISPNFKLDIHLDSLDGSIVGTQKFPEAPGYWLDVYEYSFPVVIPTGIHNIFLVFTGDIDTISGIFQSLVFSKQISQQESFNETAFELPGKIEAEEYDFGGKNISYYDNTSGNERGIFRPEDVDIEPTADAGSGYDVGYIENGEWLEYTINCSQEALTDMQFRVACMEAGEKIRVKINGDTLGTVYVSNTGDWQNWETVTLENVKIPAGENQILRLEFLEDGFNFNWIDFASFTDIREIRDDKFITFYPNPAGNYLTVQSAGEGNIEIYSLQGQLLLSKKLNSTQYTIPVDQLNPGNYVVRLVSKSEVSAEILTIK